MGGKDYFVWFLGSKSKQEIFIYRTTKTMKINPSDQGKSEDELDDGNQEYDSETEDGENKDIHYNSQSYSEKEIHKTVPTSKFTGKNNAVFVSYLGDLVYEKVGLSALCWKKLNQK
ncbi:unnamed protein product [Lactuca saligna]|uniref:Uncharacterized protein n=1 Tax=Lactuca saligna TaxID=75948 RepID=A0AA36EFX5_LACSI|nr:unnamed protein product [Lactuca saligna]